ncbi:hypothetical protein ACKWTF_015702 [Chironomus riparius]
MSFSRQILIFICIWGLLIYFFLIKLNPTSRSKETDEIERLNSALLYLEKSKAIDNELRRLLDEYVNDVASPEQKSELLKRISSKFQDVTSSSTGLSSNGVPSYEYEQLRRRVTTNVGELWNYMGTELSKIEKSMRSEFEMQQSIKQMKNFMELAREHIRSLTTDLNTMKGADGYEAYRHKESKALSDLVQKRLHYLQNPSDCSTARKLVCKINKGCGYGCQLHHIVYCFIMAYATERTLILKSKGWRYHKGGWEEIYLPVSETCLDSDKGSQGTWPQQDVQVMSVPIIDSLNPRPSYLPLAIPADLAPRLTKLHGDPIAWWIGQLLKYILKPQPETLEMLENGKNKLGFKKPIVGVHVRRTDKVGTEASFHSLEEYMKGVDDYYDQLEMVEHVDKRRVYIASDDPKVIDEARRNYPQYEVIGDPEIAKVAAVSTRYTDSSLNGIMLDIDLLSKCDYLVCTFSSQVCRVAYEVSLSI